MLTAETDFLGVTTEYEWDSFRRLPVRTTRASGTPDARTTSTEWHPQWRLPLKVTQAGRETSYTYDSLGNTLAQTIKDTTVTPAVTRTWSWTYHPSGLVATETEPNGAVASFTYDSLGNLTQATDALNRVDTYTHDAAGRVLTHTAATGLVSSFQYDLRGRLTRVQRGDQATVYTYRPTGQVATVTTPSGYAITYTYDAAQRLTGWSDNRGASATYTLDGMGNRVAENVKDSQNQTAWQVARTINNLNRVESVTVGGGVGTGAATAAATSYGYDANGDLIRSTETVDGSTRNTTLGLDALRRVKSVTNAQSASAALQYNALDAVTKATDFKSVATTYARDALGNATQEATPDSGTLTSTYDSLGLPQSITDALGRATHITRDALGRPTQIVHTQGGATRTTVLRYDLAGADYNAPGAPQASIGHLSEIQDSDVTTRYQRDLQGRITAKTQILAGGSRMVGYSYVPVGQNGAGQIQHITYPSGKQLTHVYDATGQLTGMHWAGQPLVTGLAWNPLGQPTGWQWPGFASGPGGTQALTETRDYTTAGQLAGSALLNLTWDSAGRIRQIQQKHMLPGTAATPGIPQEATLTSAYTYDTLGRLTASAHNGGPNLVLPNGYALSDTIGPNAAGYSYDANGNRSQVHYSLATAAGTSTLQRTYQSSSGTNRLSGYSQTSQAPGNSAQNTAVTYAHDGAGALTKRGDNHLHYGIDGRIAKAGLYADPSHPQTVAYTYNLLGQRILKSDARITGNVGTPTTQQTVYADDGIGSTVLGQYRNQRSTTSAAPAGEMDSTEVIYLPTASGPMPIATEINGRLYAIDSDHLNTPRRLTNSQGQVAWQWLITGFGEVAPTKGNWGYVHSNSSRNYSEAINFDLRYPGQQWDEETGLAYNLHRYYDALTGRYIQADPIGLEGGWNRFGYVNGNPLSDVDPLGLCGLHQGSCKSFPNNPLKKHPSYHEYETFMVICKLSATCTREAVFNRLREFPTPAAPTRGGVNTCDVTDISGQKVAHVVDSANFALFNITMPGHMFDHGYVYRNVYVDENGFVGLRTYGEGTGEFKGFNDFFGNYGWPAVDTRIQKPFR
ncbi:MAG: RHS repeat protein [Comamonadaceae bacterium]|nr:MAG: RHS repeat protein [Comamonadaceae bacterium]